MRNLHRLLIVLLVMALAVPLPRSCACSDLGCVCGCAGEIAGQSSGAGACSLAQGAQCCCQPAIVETQAPRGCCCAQAAVETDPGFKTCLASTCDSTECQCGCGLPAVSKAVAAPLQIKVKTLDVDFEAVLFSPSIGRSDDRKSTCLKTNAIESPVKTPNIRLAELCRWLI